MPRKPNVVVFFTDQQRHDTTGVHGCPLDLTPHFDRLTRAGTDVHYAFTPNPLCGPARACLQTGTYASTHGSFRNGIPLADTLPNLGTLMGSAGYHTAYFGKWHLHEGGSEAVPVEARAGYQSWCAANALEACSDAYQTRLFDEQDRPVDLPGYRVDALTDLTIRHLDERVRNHPDQPFFVTTSFLEPHHQNHVDDYPPPDGYRARYAGRWTPPDLAALGGSSERHLAGYYGMVKRLDEALGRVYDALKSLGVLEDTVLLFISDHGCHFRTRAKEYKRSGHESSIRIPMMLHGGPFLGGGRVDQLVSLVDVAPTILDTAGVDVPDTMQGRSLLPLVRHDANAMADWPDDAYVQVAEEHWGRAIRTKRWKYIVKAGSTDVPPEPAATYERYREVELYDLQHDPHELENLVGFESHRRVCDVMRERMRAWWERIGEPVAEIDGPGEIQPAGQRHVSADECVR